MSSKYASPELLDLANEIVESSSFRFHPGFVDGRLGRLTAGELVRLLCSYAGLNIPLEIASSLFNAPRNHADA
jgi:hypothetical protein